MNARTVLKEYAAGKRDFREANLGWANLRGADLRQSQYSPIYLSQAVSWGELSDALTTEVMKWDRACRVFGGPSFQGWKDAGACPYSREEVRAFHFQEIRNLYEPGLPSMSLAEVVVALCAEGDIKIDRPDICR